MPNKFDLLLGLLIGLGALVIVMIKKEREER